MKTPNLIKHIESHVGKIASGFSSNNKAPYSILKIEKTIITDCSALISLGLSIPLNKELIILCKKTQIEEGKVMVSLLADLFMLHPEEMNYSMVIGPYGEIPGAKGKTGFILLPPIYFSESFNNLKDPNVIFMWAIPVSNNEINYINENGTDAFIQSLEDHDPDLTDLNRPEVV